MKKETRFKFNAYLTQLGKIYGVSAQAFSDTKVQLNRLPRKRWKPIFSSQQNF
ncbi:phage major capsid, P2 family domain protein [Proteus mirabilis]|nr:phage major capsid, P2 family domain protein [Proteus mirabilis]